MPRICYIPKNFRKGSLEVIAAANRVIEEYAAQGFSLTLRQLYYQFVVRDLLPNTKRSYKRLGEIINDARLAGLVDWDHITDRTRNVRSNGHWSSPSDIISSAAASFAIDKWATQKYRPQVWIEKDALVGVIEDICGKNDVPFFSCRGYNSQSEMWSSSQRLAEWRINHDQVPIIFHLGDHDPSGKDMTRDILARMELFTGGLEVKRLALNMDQVDEFNPPPNPAKVTDPRAFAYIKEFGDKSWELDALEPGVIVDLIERAIESVKDADALEEAVEQENDGRSFLQSVSERWDEVTSLLNG